MLQNYFIHTLGDSVLANVGPQRSDWVYRLRSLLDAGIPAAGSAFLDRQLGKLVSGMLADAVVLAEDPTAVPADALDRIGVAATIIGGHAAHDPDGLFA